MATPTGSCSYQQELINAYANSFFPSSIKMLKCEFLRVANKQNPILHTYYIESTPIKEVTSAKYLGVTIDSKLTFNDHVQSITNKANQINAFIYRNLRQCPSTVKCNCYKSMVRPVLKYASTVWDPHTSANLNKIQPSVQRRAARFCLNKISNSSSITAILSSLNLPPLAIIRDEEIFRDIDEVINNFIHHNQLGSYKLFIT